MEIVIGNDVKVFVNNKLLENIYASNWRFICRVKLTIRILNNSVRITSFNIETKFDSSLNLQ